MLPQLRLLQLLSPVLPVGAYSYSQGLEWAVKEGWIKTLADFDRWLGELIDGPLMQQELPLLRKLYNACVDDDIERFDYWSHAAIAFRDTAELRAEERSRAGAYLRIVNALPLEIDERYRNGMQQTPLATLALAAATWHIDETSLLHAFAYNWLDAYIVNGVKIIPLGQSDGQELLHAKLSDLSEAVVESLDITAEALGYSVPSVAMASCGHEVQYSRIYRS